MRLSAVVVMMVEEMAEMRGNAWFLGLAAQGPRSRLIDDPQHRKLRSTCTSIYRASNLRQSNILFITIFLLSRRLNHRILLPPALHSSSPADLIKLDDDRRSRGDLAHP